MVYWASMLNAHKDPFLSGALDSVILQPAEARGIEVRVEG